MKKTKIFYRLVEKGVRLIEQMFWEAPSSDKIYEFAFIVASLKLSGASDSPMHPGAIPNTSKIAGHE
jgi:hypothetical protein